MSEAQIGSFVDERDGQTYRTVKMPDGKVWMAQNLNYNGCGGGAYDGKEANREKYGLLYGWGEVVHIAPKGSLSDKKTILWDIAPKGWHLPSPMEWMDLVMAVGGGKVAGKKLKSQSGWKKRLFGGGNGTDDYGFSALPGGAMVVDAGWGVNEYGNWWTTNEYDGKEAFYCSMTYHNDEVNVGVDNKMRKMYSLSVRCVMN